MKGINVEKEAQRINLALMKCGHKADCLVDTMTVCFICAISGNHDALSLAQAKLESRVAKCDACDKQESSSIDLRLFEHNARYAHDLYYCGCKD